jgi:7-cyano-7-deazaguanine synthase
MGRTAANRGADSIRDGEEVQMTINEHAVVLLSGGVDSSTCLAVARHEGYDLFALSFRYGQRNLIELEAAARVADAVGVVDHRVVALDLGAFGGSALTSSALAVPKSEDGLSPATGDEVPVTYVPARNSVFLALGAAWAEALGTDHLFIGVNVVDASGYPDCRPAFIEAMQRALRLGTRRGGIVIHTPLIALTKAEIIQRGTALGLDYGLTWSCYDPQADAQACGRCDSCIHRRRGFIAAGLPDPTRYAGSAT